MASRLRRNHFVFMAVIGNINVVGIIHRSPYMPKQLLPHKGVTQQELNSSNKED
jgi:hypothetical protein